MQERNVVAHPPLDVLCAFGVTEPATRLIGGQGQAFRSGDHILKPATDDERTNWIAEFYAGTTLPGFRLPKPIVASNGKYVFKGWQAWGYLSGAHCKDDWETVVQCCIAFHREIADVPRPDWMNWIGEIDPWIIADRVAWDEIPWEPHLHLAPLLCELQDCLRPLNLPAQLIHGDFGGNLLLDTLSAPAVIDFSPYWRPAGFATGIVVADAIVWEGAAESLIDEVHGIDHFDQLLARAEVRRLVELDAAHRLWGWNTLLEVDAHIPLVHALVDRCQE